ncbi:MAG: nucleotidyltransferase domain-containing protein [Deltaproteobacteria bacterium]|jgi:predicted nucleotidyltransferase|nr:nucleotidyltransferase domain-containing protein [Deltaproteobacteria bacterium]
MSLDITKIRTIVKQYVEDVRQIFKINKVFLYGSYAKGTAGKDSDVDVCFFLDSYGDIDRFDVRVLLLGMSHKYTDIYIEPMAFEVSDLYDDNPFVKEVLRTGIEIF